MKRLLWALPLFIALAIFGHLQAADPGFPIYFEDSTLLLKPQTVNRITYLPLIDIVRQLNLPYTDSTYLETLTIRGQNSRIVLTRNSNLISVNDQIVLLQGPVLREASQWLAPVDFLSLGLRRISGVEFRRRGDSARVFAGGVATSELTMNAQSLGSTTRITIRSGNPITADLRKDIAQHRATISLSPRPFDPARERLDYKDRMVQSIVFDDADGNPKLNLELTDAVTDVRLPSSNDRRVLFVDLVRETRTTETPSTPPSAAAAAATKPDAGTTATAAGIRVIVIDPGHGGIDNGAGSNGTLEKDLALTLSRKLRTSLQGRLGTTVLLTRDSDIDLASGARSSVANNNHADLFISLHIGYSANKADTGSSIYVMQEGFAAALAPEGGGDRLFTPWYLGFVSNRQTSGHIASLVQQELSKTITGWAFPIRSGPLGVLASATMPSIALELGNLNNPDSSKTLLDPAFQNKLATGLANAIERFAAERQARR